jgi:hypothetical protein
MSGNSYFCTFDPKNSDRDSDGHFWRKLQLKMIQLRATQHGEVPPKITARNREWAGGFPRPRGRVLVWHRTGRLGLKHASQRFDGMILADGTGAQFLQDLIEVGGEERRVEGDALRLHGFTAPGMLWISADALQQLIGLVDVSTNSDVRLVSVACMNWGPNVSVAITSGDHEMFDCTPEFFWRAYSA